ncbi:MAG TPA: carbohydrate porin [Steroidobacteraceae bacterium]|nr:carbohydrate porin [Steroidobacteraceae bacterium]
MSRPVRPARVWLRLLLGGCLLCQAAPGLATQDTGAADPGDEVGAAGAAGLAPGPQSRWPMFLGLQYTFVDQKQTSLLSPYQSHLSLLPQGDRQSTNTIGAYGGWAPLSWGQLYLDVEKFMGAGVSGATGVGGLTNGDVVRQGTEGLKKEFYIARLYARFMLALGTATTAVARGQDQIPGTEAARRLELKVGLLSVADDFDRNRYAGSTRTEFMNWSLWQNTAWDYAADTRGYTDGFMVGYISPTWSLRYGMYRMPQVANGQTLETLARAREQDLELTLSPPSVSTVVRLLAYYNVGNMGDYEQALAIAAETGAIPNIAADNQPGRHKVGFGVNLEQPLADDGDSGVFARLGWNDGKTEDFVFTEVDRLVSFGGQLSGLHWRRGEDRLGLAAAVDGISGPHRDYLAAGGMGFLLGDGRLNYGYEQIVEAYYKAQWSWSVAHAPLRLALTPDFQYMQNPGYNRDRGPVRFYALRVHLEY